jgi:hypothetical protein
VLAALGVAGGLLLLVRGLLDHRAHVRVADTSTSTISSLAVGEVRVSGVVEPAGLTLVSLLQSIPCVYYRSTVGAASHRRAGGAGFSEERSIGFRVRDATGTVRVFPRDARFDAPVRFEDETGTLGEEPPGLDLRRGGSTVNVELDRAIATAELLRVQEPADMTPLAGIGDRDGRRAYREARLEPGDPVTIVGRAVPYADLPDPVGADAGGGSGTLIDDPVIEADMAAARAAGTLTDDAERAWGNAAIPGFGIGRPVTAASIDPAADPLPLAHPEAASRARRTFEIAPDALVLAASDDVPLLIAFGVPGEVVRRGRTRLIVGLLGGVLAIVSAMVLALSFGGGAAR